MPLISGSRAPVHGGFWTNSTHFPCERVPALCCAMPGSTVDTYSATVPGCFWTYFPHFLRQGGASDPEVMSSCCPASCVFGEVCTVDASVASVARGNLDFTVICSPPGRFRRRVFGSPRRFTAVSCRGIGSDGDARSLLPGVVSPELGACVSTETSLLHSCPHHHHHLRSHLGFMANTTPPQCRGGCDGSVSGNATSGCVVQAFGSRLPSFAVGE